MLVRMILLIIALVAGLLVLAGQSGLLSGKTPTNLGVKDGLLKPPSNTENSVSSQMTYYPDHLMREYADIAPIAFTGSRELAWQKLEQVVRNLPRTSIIANKQIGQGRYLYAQSSTLVFRFTDDVEFFMSDSEPVIHMRSASRIGRKDFGANRARLEAVRLAFNAN
jgi:uncharacterized protein (DUF1499 family)